MSHVAPVRVGRCEVRTICEGFAPIALADEFAGRPVNWAAEREAHPWAFHGVEAWAWHVHAFVVETPDETVVVDAGVGPFGPYRPWEHWNADAWDGEDLAAVSHVVLTHLHADHAGGVERAELEPRFPNAAYHLHPADLRFFEGAHEDAYVAIRPAERLEELGVLRTEGTNHDVVPGIRLIHSPGHTPGHRSVLLRDDGVGLALTGDLLHLPLQVREREWFSAHDEDPLLGVASRRLLLWRAASQGYRVAVSHFAEPFGRIEDGRWRGGEDRSHRDPFG
jgi:glyoxylase-like metal-dependent hydrolase (beta-lactamase superfamily II)